MTSAAMSVLLAGPQPADVLAALAAAGLQLRAASDLGAAREHDAAVCWAPTVADLQALAQRRDLPQAAFDTALIVVTEAAEATAASAEQAALFALGVEAIIDVAALPRAVRHAVWRKQFERAARTAYATDLATGLPHQTQLLEHMTQLLALREREPAPMVLLVLQVDGFAQAASRLGAESANILRRKVAVRLRAALRASDVVASMGPDAFGVLLGHVEALGDGDRVAAKLQRSLQQPVLVAGQQCSVAASIGLALYPDHGKDAPTLLQRATAQAGGIGTVGRAGLALPANRGSSAAANDEA